MGYYKKAKFPARGTNVGSHHDIFEKVEIPWPFQQPDNLPVTTGANERFRATAPFW